MKRLTSFKGTKKQDSEEFFERKLLTAMITSSEFLERAMPVLDLTLLESPELAQVGRWCVDYFQKYNKAPGRAIQDIYMKELKNDKLPKSTAEYIEEMLSDLSEDYEQQQDFNINYLYDLTVQYIQERELFTLGEDFLQMLRQRKIEQAKELIYNFSMKTDTMQDKPRTMTGAELLNSDVSEPAWVVPGLILAGLTILAGKAKLGKSFLVLYMAVMLARGGKVLGKIQAGPMGVLYLALEDPTWRIKARLADIVDEEEIERLHIATEWRRGPEGIRDLEAWLQEHPEVKIVFIDVLEKFRSLERGREQIYRADYQEVNLIKELANKHDIAVVVVHHTRKAASTDDIDLVLGSTGLVGAADSVLIMKRARGENDAVLFVTGRDVEEQSLALSRSHKHGWRLSDADVREFEQTPERQKLLQILREIGKPARLQALARAAGKSEQNVRIQLKKLMDDGIVYQPEYGKYAIAGGEKRKGIVKGNVIRNAQKWAERLEEEWREEGFKSYEDYRVYYLEGYIF